MMVIQIQIIKLTLMEHICFENIPELYAVLIYSAILQMYIVYCHASSVSFTPPSGERHAQSLGAITSATNTTLNIIHSSPRGSSLEFQLLTTNSQVYDNEALEN